VTLRRSNTRNPSARLRATLDSLLDPHVVLTAVRDGHGQIVDFEFTDANSAACAYNGMTYEELMGRRLLEFLPAHGTSGLFGMYQNLIDTGESLVLDDFVYPLELLGAPSGASTSAAWPSATAWSTPGEM
jgi:PAS domain-containing protein